MVRQHATGTLHQLCEFGHRKKGNWDKVLSYLHAHSSTSVTSLSDKGRGSNKNFVSVPSAALVEECLAKKPETPLRLCVGKAPSRVVSALIDVTGEPCRMPDAQDRIPLHYAARRPTGGMAAGVDAENVLRVLVESFPGGLLWRDVDGRTPLHWIFLYHAPSRTTSTTELLLRPLPLTDFCNVLYNKLKRQVKEEQERRRLEQLEEEKEKEKQEAMGEEAEESGEVTLDSFLSNSKSFANSPTKKKSRPRSFLRIPEPNEDNGVPYSAVIIPDSEGCLPLHFAAGEGAAREVIKSLVSMYPGSIQIGDRYGRTPLHWYLSVGLPDPIIDDSEFDLPTKSEEAGAEDKVDSDDDLHPSDGTPHENGIHHHDVDNTDHDSKSQNRPTPNKAIDDAPPPPPPRSTNVISLLLNPTVASTAEIPEEGGQLPLHVACRLLSLSIAMKFLPTQKNDIGELINSGLGVRGGDKEGSIKIRAFRRILEANRDALLKRDSYGRTPLHVFLHGGYEHNLRMYRIFSSRGNQVSDRTFQRFCRRHLHQWIRPFEAPLEVVRVLIFHPNNDALPAMPTITTPPSNDKKKKRNKKNPALLEDDDTADQEDQSQQPNNINIYNGGSMVDDNGSFSSGASAAQQQSENFPTPRTPEHEDFASENSGGTLSCHVEDVDGRLPLHYACRSACPPEVLDLLVRLVPPSLITTDDANGRTPLHAAFGSVPAAALQTLGTTTVLLDGVIGAEVLDGRCALKMDDLSLRKPLHLAAENGATLPVLQKLYEEHPVAATCRNEEGELPLHGLFGGCITKLRAFSDRSRLLRHKKSGNGAVEDETTTCGVEVVSVGNEEESTSNPYEIRSSRRYEDDEDDDDDVPVDELDEETLVVIRTEHEEHLQKIRLLFEPIMSGRDMKDVNDDLLGTAGGICEIMPLHVVVAYDVLPPTELLPVLVAAPNAAVAITTGNSEGYTALDLHEMRKGWPYYSEKDEDESSRRWKDLKIMLFAYRPDTLPYRRDGAFLGELALRVRAEVETTTVLSEVGTRLWVFFCTFIGKEWTDHYAEQIETVVTELAYELYCWLASIRVPYRGDVVECAHPKCAEILRGCPLFVGRYAIPVGLVSSSSSLPPRPSVCRHRSQPITVGSVGGGVGGSNLIVKAEEWSFRANEGDLLTKQRPVCIKFFHVSATARFKREVRQRERLSLLLVGDDYGDNDEEKLVAPDGSLRKAPAVLPLIRTYNSAENRKSDRRYRYDIHDPRFHPRETHEALSNFPTAVVTPLADRDLSDILLHEGLSDVKLAARQIGGTLQTLHKAGIVYTNLSTKNILRLPLQSKSSCHGNPDTFAWVLSDLSASHTVDASSPSYVGEIGTFSTGVLPPEMFAKLESPDQLRQYHEYWHGSTLSSSPTSSASIQPVSVLEPLHTYGSDRDDDEQVFVVKAHRQDDRVDGNKSNNESHKNLPYDLVPANTSLDLWSYGLILFSLLTGGRTLFPVDARNGHLRDNSAYGALCQWDTVAAEDHICAHVEDFLAQDLLSKLLCALEGEGTDVENENDRRRGCPGFGMTEVLNHPYFTHTASTMTIDNETIEIIRTRRQSVMEARNERLLQEQRLRETRRNLKARSHTAVRLSVDLQMRIARSASELCREVFRASDKAPCFPLFWVVLPYKLVPNKAGKLTPSSKRDVELAEKIGKQLLNLSKASSFVVAVRRILDAQQRRREERSRRQEERQKPSGSVVDPNALRDDADEDDDEDARCWEGWADRCRAEPQRVAYEILRATECSDDYHDLSHALVAMASFNTDQFVSEPYAVAKKLVQESVKAVLKTFDDADRVYLYLVDELHRVPLARKNDSTYPLVFEGDQARSLVREALPVLQAGILYARAVQGSVAGLVKLIFEGAYPHIPTSWTASSKGLDHQPWLRSQQGEKDGEKPKDANEVGSREREDSMVAEIRTVVEALEGLSESFFEVRRGRSGFDAEFSGGNDRTLCSLEARLLEHDPLREFGGLQRVVNGDASLWTTMKGVDELIGNANDPSTLMMRYAEHERIAKELGDKDSMIRALQTALREKK